MPSYEFSIIFTLNYLHTLYTQLRWITHVAQVLPRLLAPVFATTSFCTLQHNSSTWSNFTTTIAFFVPVKLLGHTFVHCPIFCTAAHSGMVFISHVVDPPLSSTVDHKHNSIKIIFFYYFLISSRKTSNQKVYMRWSRECSSSNLKFSRFQSLRNQQTLQFKNFI